MELALLAIGLILGYLLGCINSQKTIDKLINYIEKEKLK